MLDELLINPCDNEDRKTIISGLINYNLNKVPALAANWNPLEFVVNNKSGEKIAGIISGIGYWNELEIQILWVKEGHRNTGVGTKLLKHVEEVAIKKGAKIAMLDTFDFQAEEFYLKNRYKKVGEIANYPEGHKRIYFSKLL